MRIGYQDQLPNCCGVYDIGSFGHTYADSSPSVRRPGTGLFTATFINNQVQKEHYEELCRTHKLLYQSPVRRNTNSSNSLFLCVFMHNEAR